MTYVGSTRRRRDSALVMARGVVYLLSLLSGVAAAIVMLPGYVRRGQPLNGWLRPTAQAIHAAAVRDSRELAAGLR